MFAMLSVECSITASAGVSLSHCSMDTEENDELLRLVHVGWIASDEFAVLINDFKTVKQRNWHLVDTTQITMKVTIGTIRMGM